MEQLLTHIVKGIVNNPDAVVVTTKESVDFPGLFILTIDVADEDKGILIGRRGRTINAIRDIMTIAAIRGNKRIKVMVKDDRDGNAGGEFESQQSTAPTARPTDEVVKIDEPAPIVSETMGSSEAEDMLTDEI